MREQGKAAAWCGRLLLFTALIVGIVTTHTSGYPMTGHDGHDTRVVLCVWALALLVLLGVGTLTGRPETGLLAAVRARLPHGRWQISASPRLKLLARLSVLRV
ncbi:hypothetical protein [Streptomyces inhibens]|uniref:hypothetical protein n=1 Tax=Streptomyces inhibens TaxID=2293571 RepID=UPI001EE6F710|nr:hypothetical protein [Streptomyces inhibens]UKY49789.1 hypothetical protein KI385_13845 [Streptomyces inhibens]